VFVASLALVETTLRMKGATPSAGLTPARWSAQYEKALESSHPFTTALLGSSQIAGGFSSAVFSRRYPGTPLHFLVSVGDSPFAVLLHLADETTFSGRLIVSLDESYLENHRLEDQRDVLDYYEDDWRISRRIDFWIEDRLGRLLAFRQTRFAPSTLLSGVVRGDGLPLARDWRNNRPTGEADYHFALADPDYVSQRRARFDRPVGAADKAAWRANFARLDAAVTKILARGGQVALVKWPLAGSWATANQQRFPRSEYWDAVVTSGHAVAVDAAQIPGVDKLPLPDGNHLDADDKDVFTELLLDELEAAGLRFSAHGTVTSDI
jgi:hypothetical protein